MTEKNNKIINLLDPIPSDQVVEIFDFFDPLRTIEEFKEYLRNQNPDIKIKFKGE